MRAEKDRKTGRWLIQYRYTDWQGRRRKSTKRGFRTKREAEEWLRNFLMAAQSDFGMRFSEFVNLYYEDMGNRLRENTMRTKKYIIAQKILPYFGEKRMCDITPSDIRNWQNVQIQKGYTETYLKTIHNQLAAIFNYAVKYYDLKNNPCPKAGSMGKSNPENVNFWTKQEFMQFIDRIPEGRTSRIIFSVLYWTGIREGELLALTPSDIDFQERTLSISKSYQRLNRRDVITPPKTPKSKRIIKIPEFLVKDLHQYLNEHAVLNKGERLFSVTKYYLKKEMDQGIELSQVKKIRIHDLRHSHASLLVEMGFTPLEIAERLGHEKIETTLNIYSHLYPDRQERLADRLDQEYQDIRIVNQVKLSLRDEKVCGI